MMSSSSATASPPTNGGNGTKPSSSLQKARYVAAPTWQGVKRGYYFGTGSAGTGYYLDNNEQQKPSFHTKRHGTNNGGSEKQQSSPLNKKARKSVQIAEDRNEIKLYSTIKTTSAADLLLAQAEQQQGASKVVALTVAGVKAAAAGLKKAIQTNALQRAKEEEEEDGYDAAALYMESEVALYEHIAALKAFAADPATLYPVLLEQNVLSDLVQLLLHDNVDIAVAVTAVLLEWLDVDLMLLPQQSDSLVSTEKVDDDSAHKRRQALTRMATSLLQHDVSDGGAELLVENLARMMPLTIRGEDNDDDDVGRGVADILSLLENLLEMDSLEPPLLLTSRNGSTSVAAHFCKETALVPWIFQQLDDTGKDSAKGGLYRDRAMELLAYLAPREDIYSHVRDWCRIPLYTSTFNSSGDGDNNNSTKEKKDKATVDGIEILLQCVATFRKRQPASDSEVEFLENSCMVLASVLTYSSAAVQSFLDAQGIELVMRCLKERVYAAGLALKWLDFAGSESVYRRACEHLVQAGALKYIFPLFLGHNLPKYYSKAKTTKQKKAKNDFHQSVESTTVRILYALIRHLRKDSPDDALERVLAKFVGDSDEDNAKVNRLVDLLLTYDQRARLAEYKFFRSDVEETLLLGPNDSIDSKESLIQFAALDAKLAAGGDIWHRLAVIAAFVSTGSKQCHRQVLARLHAKGSGIGLVREALEEFVSVLDETSDQKEQLQSYLEHI